MPISLVKDPPKTPTTQRRKWKGKYKGKWYVVEDVKDMGSGKQNLYRLEGVDGLVAVEDLDPTGLAASFKEKVESKYQLED